MISECIHIPAIVISPMGQAFKVHSA